ncbi:MAG: hypothetical protein AAGM84_17945 [Pseudomonadota bacterium]
MFDPNAPVQTDATLLFRRSPVVDFDSFCAALNAALDLRADMQLSLSAERGRDHALLTSASFHILVSVSRRPYPRGAMAKALCSAVTRHKSYDFDKAVSGHKSHITVHVGNGPDFLDADMEAARIEAGQALTAEPMPVGFRTAVLRVAVELLSQDGLRAVHWRQSNMMLAPGELHSIGSSDVPALQAIHPLPTRDRTHHDAHGIIAAHSEHFAGRTVEVDPGTRSLSASVAMALSMVIEKEAGRLPLNHGDTLDTVSGETLYVRHEAPCKTWPAGRICLGTMRPAAPEAQDRCQTNAEITSLRPTTDTATVSAHPAELEKTEAPVAANPGQHPPVTTFLQRSFIAARGVIHGLGYVRAAIFVLGLIVTSVISAQTGATSSNLTAALSAAPIAQPQAD